MKLTILYFDKMASRIFKEEETEDGKKIIKLTSGNNFVSRNEIVLRVVDVDKPEDAKNFIDKGYTYYHIFPYSALKCGTGIVFDETEKCYRSIEYGFVIIDPKKVIRILTPIQVSKDKTSAYYYIYPTKLNKISTSKDIQTVISTEQISLSVNDHVISSELKKINVQEKKITKLQIAKSNGPVNGVREYYEPLIDIDKKAGKVLADGSMDFREIHSIIQVTKNDEIVKRHPEIKPVDGYNIYGDKIPAELEPPKGYSKGENLAQSFNDENIFVAAIDGCLIVNKKNISIKEIAIINGDIDYKSGNIDFNGSVQIKGAVLPGFSIKAKGDIIIEKNVDDALIETDGNVTIKMGIAGKGETKIIAGGNVVAKYILNAFVQCEGFVQIEDSIINSRIFSNDYISVVSQHGKIMGGEIIAKNYIEVNVAGSNNETSTSLTVGRNLQIERELEQIRKEMSFFKENVADVMAKIKLSFGTTLFENPKEYISYLPAIKKKQCVELLSELSKNNKELKTLAIKGVNVESRLVFDKDPVIIIKDKAFRGTVINIKKYVRKIEEDMQNAKFYLDNENKVIRFASAI